LSVAERFAQDADVEPQAALIHRDIGPDTLDQVSLANNVAGVFQQYDQYVECTTAQDDRGTRLIKTSLRRHQSKRAERDLTSSSDSLMRRH
jgi:hypothetical protein